MRTLLSCLLPSLFMLVSVAQAESVVLTNNLKPKRGLKYEEEAAIKLEKGTLQLIIAGQYTAGEVGADLRDRLTRTFKGAVEQQVEFHESQRNILFFFGGTKSAPKIEAGKLTGRTLEGRRTEEKWQFKLPGREAPDAALSKAITQFEGYSQALDIFPFLYGTERREVGKAWKPDLSAIVKSIPGLAVQVECRVDELLRVEGVECAKIAVAIVARYNNPKLGVFDSSLSGTILRSLDDNLDLDTNLVGTLKFKGFFGKDPNNPTTDVQAEAPLTLRRTVKVLKR
jgi:hypothetical protein